MTLIKNSILCCILTIVYSLNACTTNFEEEALFDTPNRISPNLDGTFPSFPKGGEKTNTLNFSRLQNPLNFISKHSTNFLAEFSPGISFD